VHMKRFRARSCIDNFFIISARVGFMDFHTKKYQEMTRWSSFLGRDAQNFILNFYDFYINVYGFLKFN
jgi:hypothetical protein